LRTAGLTHRKPEGWHLMLLQTNKGMQVVDTTHTPPALPHTNLAFVALWFLFLYSKK